MSEIFNLYKSVESFIDNNCVYKKNDPFIINYSTENENSGGLPTINDKSKYIQCVINIPEEKQDILKDAKDTKINILDSSFEFVLYKNNTTPSLIKCLLLLIINDIEKVDTQETEGTENKNKKELNNINHDHNLLENLSRFIYNYIKKNKKKNKSSDNVIETILLKDAKDGIRFFNFRDNGINYENENTKKIIEIIKSIPSKLEIKKRTSEHKKPKEVKDVKDEKEETKKENENDINEVLDELNPDYKNELIDRYLDEMPEEIVNLMKRYKNINFTKNMYNEYIDKAKNTENGEQIENNNENVRQENVEEAV
jgi:hypothetical protein